MQSLLQCPTRWTPNMYVIEQPLVDRRVGGFLCRPLCQLPIDAVSHLGFSPQLRIPRWPIKASSNTKYFASI